MIIVVALAPVFIKFRLRLLQLVNVNIIFFIEKSYEVLYSSIRPLEFEIVGLTGAGSET